MALSREDLHELSEVQPLNEREIDTVAGFNAPPSWKQERSSDGRPVPPPGAGKFMLKIPGRIGIAVQMTLTETERVKHITDERSVSTNQLMKGRVG